MGSKTQTSTTENSPWKPAVGALESILGQAGELFDKNGGINAEFIDKEIADLTPEMQAAIKNLVNSDKFTGMAEQMQQATQQGMSGIGQATGMLGGLAQSGITSADINAMAKDLYDSELVGSQKESLAADVQKSLSKQVQDINQRAGGSGNMGSSRAGVAEGVAITGANEAIAQGNAAIENAARTQAVGQAVGTLQGNQQTALGAAGQLGQLGLGSVGQFGQSGNLINMGFQNQLTGSGILQGHQQNILNNKWMNAMGQQQAGWNNLNNYLGIAGSIGSMGGTSTTTGKTSGGGWGQALGGLASIGVGAMTGGIGTAMGGAMGGAMLGPKPSDRRLKDKTEVIREAHTRVNAEGKEYPVPTLYKWEWNDLALQMFIEHAYSVVPPAFGVIAQELEETGFSDFVEEIETGVEGLDGKVKVVNYPALCLYVGIEPDEG